MTRLNGGQALIESLQRGGVGAVFGIPGAGQYEAVDALYGRTEIRYISLRHEQAASYMAHGYARASGKIAAVLVVPGPGIYNAAAGIATAYAASSPMIVITGTRHQEGAPAAQDELAWYNNLTKWAARAERPAQIPALVQEALRQLQTGRPRPVVIEISAQVFAMQEEVELPDGSWAMAAPPTPSAAQIARAAQMLAQAQRPVIWAGGGVQTAEAGPLLQALAEELQTPVVTSAHGKGVISERHPLCLGYAELRYPPLRAWLEERDLVLAVGTRSDVAKDLPNAQVIRIDIDAGQIGQRARQFAIVADARQALSALQASLPDRPPPRSDVAAEVHALNTRRFDPARQLQPQWDLMAAIRNAMPDDAILVQGMNQMGYYSRNYFPVYAPRSYITASQLATLGAAFPQALGAKLAQPERAVVAICGDGGFLYNAQELASAVQYGLHVVVVIFNDNAYGNVLRAQDEQFDGRIIGTQLRNPDFVQLAQAYGARGVRAHGSEELHSALSAAIAIDAPTLIEAPVGRMKREF
ncbi:MAG: thiamine pyrophosphate-binding protein [Chloroflexi bacterium]|nr:thiamine pyrophosphate-binding protein [Chloroflexota bacterium]